MITEKQFSSLLDAKLAPITLDLNVIKISLKLIENGLIEIDNTLDRIDNLSV